MCNSFLQMDQSVLFQNIDKSHHLNPALPKADGPPRTLVAEITNYRARQGSSRPEVCSKLLMLESSTGGPEMTPIRKSPMVSLMQKRRHTTWWQRYRWLWWRHFHKYDSSIYRTLREHEAHLPHISEWRLVPSQVLIEFWCQWIMQRWQNSRQLGGQWPNKNQHSE